MSSRILALILLSSLSFPLFALTQIRDTLVDAKGALANGQVFIEWYTPFSTVGGKYVPAPNKLVVPVTLGKFSITLEPTDTATPSGVTYFVRYAFAGGTTAGPEQWVVPTTSSTLTITSVRAATPPTASTIIPLSQFAQSGATVGQVLTWSGSSWLPASLPPGGVTSVNGSTGAVTVSVASIGAQAALGFTPENAANRNIANGYAPLDGSVKVPLANIPAAIPATSIADGTVTNAMYQYLSGATSNIQTQLSARPTGSGASAKLAYWSSATGLGQVDGTYDSTNKNMTINHLGSGYSTFGVAGGSGPFYQRWDFRHSSTVDYGELRFIDSTGFPRGILAWDQYSGFSISGVSYMAVTTLGAGTISQAAAPFCSQAGASVTIDFSVNGGGWDSDKCILTGNRTLVVSNAPQTVTFLFCQDATGGRTLAWPANFKGGMTISATANKCSVQEFKSFGTGTYYATSAGITGL